MSIVDAIDKGLYNPRSLAGIAASVASTKDKPVEMEGSETAKRRKTALSILGPESQNIVMNPVDPSPYKTLSTKETNSVHLRSSCPLLAQPAQVYKNEILLPGLRVELATNQIRLIQNIPRQNKCYFYVPVFTDVADVGKYIKQKLILTNLTGQANTIKIKVNDKYEYEAVGVNGMFTCNYWVYAADTFCFNKVNIEYVDQSIIDLYVQEFYKWKPANVQLVMYNGTTALRENFNPVAYNTTDTDEGLKLMSMDLKFNEGIGDALYPYKFVTVKRGITQTEETYTQGSVVHTCGFERYDNIYSNYVLSNYPSSKPLKHIGTRNAKAAYIARLWYYKTIP